LLYGIGLSKQFSIFLPSLFPKRLVLLPFSFSMKPFIRRLSDRTATEANSTFEAKEKHSRFVFTHESMEQDAIKINYINSTINKEHYYLFKKYLNLESGKKNKLIIMQPNSSIPINQNILVTGITLSPKNIKDNLFSLNQNLHKFHSEAPEGSTPAVSSLEVTSQILLQKELTQVNINKKTEHGKNFELFIDKYPYPKSIPIIKGIKPKAIGNRDRLNSL